VAVDGLAFFRIYGIRVAILRVHYFSFYIDSMLSRNALGPILDALNADGDIEWRKRSDSGEEIQHRDSKKDRYRSST
jgi:hypothetical protein